MSPPRTRILATIQVRQTVFLRSPTGQLSRAKVTYASGSLIKTNKRRFSRVTGEELDPPEGQDGLYAIYRNDEVIAAEYATQCSRTSNRLQKV